MARGHLSLTLAPQEAIPSFSLHRGIRRAGKLGLCFCQLDKYMGEGKGTKRQSVDVKLGADQQVKVPERSQASRMVSQKCMLR